MSIATVTSKGQITIPQDVRERLGIVTGSRVEFVEGPEGGVEFVPLTGSVAALAGVVTWVGPPLTIAQIDEGIGNAVAENDRRSRE
jgi:AbrB family looped-hinge helix DNA binding protein